MLENKLTRSKNCFFIVPGRKYFAVVGDKTTIYRNSDYSVQCVITALSNVGDLHFISDREVIIKNNSGRYVIFDVEQKCVVWKCKLPGKRYTEYPAVLSEDEAKLLDIEGVEPLRAITVWTKEHRIHEEIIPDTENMHGFGWFRPLLSQNCENGATVLLSCNTPLDRTSPCWLDLHRLVQSSPPFTAPFTVQSEWRRGITKGCVSFRYGVYQDAIGRREPVYLDHEYLLWDDFQYYSFPENGWGCFTAIAKLHKPVYSVKRQYIANTRRSVLIIHFSSSHGVVLLSLPDGQILADFTSSEMHVTDIAVLNASGTLAVGTMEGVFLYRLQNVF